MWIGLDCGCDDGEQQVCIFPLSRGRCFDAIDHKDVLQGSSYYKVLSKYKNRLVWFCLNCLHTAEWILSASELGS